MADPKAMTDERRIAERLARTHYGMPEHERDADGCPCCALADLIERALAESKSVTLKVEEL